MESFRVERLTEITEPSCSPSTATATRMSPEQGARGLSPGTAGATRGHPTALRAPGRLGPSRERGRKRLKTNKQPELMGRQLFLA